MTRQPRALLLPFLVAAGTCAPLVLIVIVVTGGFVIDAGPLHLSARRLTSPILIAVAAWTAALFLDRQALAATTAAVLTFLERHAVALALVLASAAAGAGVAYGTYSASGSDAAGYVSQSALLASGSLIRDEPLARQVMWPDATWVFSPLGYRPGQTIGEIVPTYPSGLPLTMTAARLMLGDIGPFLVVPLFGALAVFCTYAIGARLHSRIAGLAAAALLATSPIVLFQIVQPMSDVPAAALWALALLLALTPSPGSALAAGAVSGFAILIRPNLALLAIPVAIASRRWVLPGPGQSSGFAAGMVPALGALSLLQWRLNGNPFASGYGAVDDLFSLANVAPNLRAYAMRLLTGETPAVFLAIASMVVIALTRRRAPSAFRLPPEATRRAPVAVAAFVAAAVLVSYLPYGVFAEWSYLRFLLPALPLAFVLVSSLLVNAADALPASTRGLVVLLAITAACAANVNIAAREQAFNLRRYEARYRTAGRYLEAALPPNAVVLAFQESGGVSYYARTPIVRWDMLRVDLDTAAATLEALGRHPVLLVEDWEAAGIRARFPASAIARLDWTPRADFGTETRVRLFDPADRERRGNPPITDRLP